MDKITDHKNSSNHNIYSYDQTRTTIFNLSSNKGKNNNNSCPQLTHLHNLLLMSIVRTPEKYLSNVDGKYDMIKVRTSSVNPSSTLFS